MMTVLPVRSAVIELIFVVMAGTTDEPGERIRPFGLARPVGYRRQSAGDSRRRFGARMVKKSVRDALVGAGTVLADGGALACCTNDSLRTARRAYACSWSPPGSRRCNAPWWRCA